MSRQAVTRRQKDISRLLRERKQARSARIESSKKRGVKRSSGL